MAENVTDEIKDVPDVVGPLDGYRPTRSLPVEDYVEYADRRDPR